MGLGGAFLVGCGKTDDARAAAKNQKPASPVKVARAELRPMTRSIAVTGTLAAQEKSTLSAKVTGRVQNLLVDLGSVVRQGDLLAQIEPRDYELGLQQAAAALAQTRTALGLPAEGEDDRVDLERVSAVRQAKAVLEEANKNRDRVKSLSKSGIASQAEVDTVEAAYKVAVSRADTALEEARVRTAAVAQRRAEYELAAQTVGRCLRARAIRRRRPGSDRPCWRIRRRWARPSWSWSKPTRCGCGCKCPSASAPWCAPGRWCTCSWKAIRTLTPAESPGLAPRSTTRIECCWWKPMCPAAARCARACLPAPTSSLTSVSESLSVPAEALITFAGIEKVVVVQEGKALEKVVVTGRRGPDWAEIISGISAGEQIIVNPGGLRTGQPVSITTGDASVVPRGPATERATN